MALLERKYKAAAKTELDRDKKEFEQRGKILNGDESLLSSNKQEPPKISECILVDEQNASERIHRLDEKVIRQLVYNPNDDYENGEERGIKLRMSAWKSKIDEEKYKRQETQGLQSSQTHHAPENEIQRKKAYE